MGKNTELKTVAAVLGTTFAVSLAAAPLANAAENPFGATTLKSGYVVAADEGKCGGGMSMGKGEEGKCGGAQPSDDKKDSTEGKTDKKGS